LHGLSALPDYTAVFVSRVGKDGHVELELNVCDRSVSRPKGENAILKKLNEIVERLDALEKEIRDLRASFCKQDRSASVSSQIEGQSGALLPGGRLQDKIEEVLGLPDGTYLIGANGEAEKAESLPAAIDRAMKRDSTDVDVVWLRGGGKIGTTFWSGGEPAYYSFCVTSPKEAKDELGTCEVWCHQGTALSRDDRTLKGEDAILEKLNEIIKRLDALEKEVCDLKAYAMDHFSP
jgi:hypothetical protein